MDRFVISGTLFNEEAWNAQQVATRRPAQVAQMLAFAHGLNISLEKGDWVDQSDVARHFNLSRARITQLLSLTYLAPDIQEELLFLEAVDGQEPLAGRTLLQIPRHISWAEQRKRWRKMRRVFTE